MCSYTSSLMSTMLVGSKISCSVSMSCLDQIMPLGLCGELIRMARVLGVIAARILSKSGRKVPGLRGTRTTTPPANSMLGT